MIGLSSPPNPVSPGITDRYWRVPRAAGLSQVQIGIVQLEIDKIDS